MQKSEGRQVNLAPFVHSGVPFLFPDIATGWDAFLR
jgi:hypothetical protein